MQFKLIESLLEKKLANYLFEPNTEQTRQRICKSLNTLNSPLFDGILCSDATTKEDISTNTVRLDVIFRNKNRKYKKQITFGPQAFPNPDFYEKAKKAL